MQPLVSIITINYHQADVTCALLDSLDRVTYPSFEVIVVDNGSGPDDLERLRKRTDRIRLVEAGANLGFTGGNNLGMDCARGDYFLLLNNDTEVEPDFLDALVKAMEADPRIGLASPKIRYHHTPELIQYAGGRRLNPYTIQGAWIGSREQDLGQYDADRDTDLAHGAAMMIRREVVETVGGLGEDFFIFYEELDFSERVRRSGWTIRYVSGSTVWHKESLTVGRETPFRTYYMTRNRLLYLRRNVFGLHRLSAALWFSCVTIPGQTARFAVRRRWDLLGAFWRGVRWHIDGPRQVEAVGPQDPRPSAAAGTLMSRAAR